MVIIFLIVIALILIYNVNNTFNIFVRNLLEKLDRAVWHVNPLTYNESHSW